MGGRFVIQQHDATTMHWDLRLEVDGTLKSWAVPKGPSTDPGEKRLAIATPDHSLDYIDYEGVIPEGEYGAGPVIVWDTGRYRNLTTGGDGREVPMGRALAGGHATFSLEGHKLNGGYSLRRWGGGRKWLLVKMDDEAADRRGDPVNARPESVLSGRTVDEVSG